MAEQQQQQHSFWYSVVEMVVGAHAHGKPRSLHTHYFFVWCMSMPTASRHRRRHRVSQPWRKRDHNGHAKCPACFDAFSLHANAESNVCTCTYSHCFVRSLLSRLVLFNLRSSLFPFPLSLSPSIVWPSLSVFSLNCSLFSLSLPLSLPPSPSLFTSAATFLPGSPLLSLSLTHTPSAANPPKCCHSITHHRPSALNTHQQQQRQ